MADDELSAPLGRTAKKKPRRRFRPPITFSQVIMGVLVLFLLVCGGWALMVDDPLGGEPIAVAAISADAPKAAAASPPNPEPSRPHGGGSIQGPAQPIANPTPTERKSPPSTTRTVTIIDGSTGNRQEVAIPAAGRDVRAPLEQRLLEPSRYGAIPRIAPDGTRPFEFYARAVTAAAARKDGPRIAIVVGGLGVGSTLTSKAIDKLPAPVTLAFTPYGADIERLVTRARAEGHEVLLHAAMEPFDYPDNDPGPQTLLTSLPSEQNIDRLYWQMSRFQGYVGIVNYMGARFTATEQALGPVLKEIARRGLIYIDDGSSPRSIAGQIAGANNMPFAKGEVMLDAVPTPANIDKALARLEALAREHGAAIGVASALPVSIDRIGQWAKAAEQRGFLLVPITAAAIKPKSS